MADDTAPQGAPEINPITTTAGAAIAPPEPQETDWKAEARKWESRAKENLAAAKANETAAQRLVEIESANQTEAEKAAKRAEVAEKRAADLEMRATRAEVAAAKGVPADLLTGSTQEELEASADALIAFRGEQQQKLHVPGEGNSPKTSATTNADRFAEFAEGKLTT